MRVNWCASCGAGRNFGDQLGPRLLRLYGHLVEWAPPGKADLVTAGSILSKVPDGWSGTVLGTGFIRQGMRKDLRRARVLAVRGELTRRAARLPRDTFLADPGILAPRLSSRRSGNHGRCVALPHYVDAGLGARHPEALAARITDDPADLIDAVAGASLVFTSSLHGLVLADALGVPHVLEPHEAVIGGLFKFRDYASAFGETVEPGVERLTARGPMLAAQERMSLLFGTV